MAYGNLCVRCGHEESSHNPNLVNEPAEGDFRWIEKIKRGYSMDILTCMENKHPPEYIQQTEKLWWRGRAEGFARTLGYLSPDPKAEAARPENQYTFRQTAFLILPGGMGILELD